VGQPALSPNGKTIFFMSDTKQGNYGKTDIFYSKKQDNGTWSRAINIGNEVNTFGYELFPYAYDDSTLYFSSNAHPGMGQLDLFKCTLVNGKWGKVQNLKPPINSIGNDFGITFDAKMNRGFFSSDRFNGKGSEDIYSFSNENLITLALFNDSIAFSQTKLFDNVSVKLFNRSDSLEIDLDPSVSKVGLKLKSSKFYELVYKKNGFTINSVVIETLFDEKEGDYKYQLIPSMQAMNIITPTGEIQASPGDETITSWGKN
jgi:peptidoglycan-associated lipoprotein